MNGISQYKDAVEAIKTAILQSQYEALKSINRIQLALYFGVGKYLSIKTRKGAWGTGALKTISSQLQRELPGLRGFSATSLKKMRLFYENWNMLDATSSVTTDEIEIHKSPLQRTIYPIMLSMKLQPILMYGHSLIYRIFLWRIFSMFLLRITLKYIQRCRI